MVTVFQNWMYTRLAAAFVMGNTEVARAMHLTWGNNRSNTKYIEELKTFAKLACLLKWNSQLKTVFPGVCAPSSFEPVQMLTYFLQLNYIFECWNLEKKKDSLRTFTKFQVPGEDVKYQHDVIIKHWACKRAFEKQLHTRFQGLNLTFKW